MSDRPEIGKRLRDLADRPIDKPHPRAAIALIALITLLAVVLNVVSFPTPKTEPARAPKAPAVTPEPAVAPEPAAEPAQVKVADLRAAKRAAKRFLRSYLPYTYGQRSARHITAATPALIRKLKANSPRVPPGSHAKKRHPRVEVLTTAEDATATAITFAALIDDGAQAPYNVTVVVEFRDDKWIVTSI